LAGLKGLLKKERNSLYKHLVHAANYMQSPSGAKKKIFAETGVDFPLDVVERVMSIYFELFPEIRTWHSQVLHQADKDGYIRNAYGYLMRFSHVFDWEKVEGVWQKKPNPDVANKVIASGPQSNAAGIIKESMLTLSRQYFEEAGQWLRLLVHDELLFDVPVERLQTLDSVCKHVMEAPLKQFSLPASYGLGEHLSILTEAKQGPTWAQMK
jgi:DNA polymerase I-like protein with 3'-5' exonuclease and polymerase domains